MTIVIQYKSYHKSAFSTTIAIKIIPTPGLLLSTNVVQYGYEYHQGIWGGGV
ncbi:hypothetical protein FWH58_02560 [Candidatus Saccharibacteria bacterium]|nr:hypothetical protein [Candidatus Saccharibacteria bacterium]